MMDTVLNIGLNDAVVEGLAKLTGNERFAYDSYRRLINMFGDTVMGVDHHHFEHELSASQEEHAASKLDTDLDADGLKEVVRALQDASTRSTSAPISRSDPFKQLEAAIEAVFKSWMGDRGDQVPRARTTSAACSARPSTCSRWSSATWATTAPPASPSPATRPPARTSSTASSSSTRRAKTSSPASARRSSARPRWASGARRAGRNCWRSRTALEKPLQGRAGLRVHHREGQALHAADPQRQAHRAGRRAHRRRHGEGEADRREDGDPARRSGVASTSCCTRRSTPRPTRT